MPDTEEWALYLTSHLLCWKAWCVIVGEGVGGGGPGMRKPGPLPQMSLEDNGKPDIKADRLQSCVSQQQEDPFVLVRGSGRAPGGGGIGSKLFRHYKRERKCQALGQQRELLTQSRLVGVWGKEIGNVGRPSRIPAECFLWGWGQLSDTGVPDWECAQAAVAACWSTLQSLPWGSWPINVAVPPMLL